MKTSLSKTFATLAALSALALPIAASAAVPGETQLRGTITAFDGKYDLHVQNRNGEVDDVALHKGTIINPTGLTLWPGMRVTIVGDRAGETLNANEIDTPYQIEYVAPAISYWEGGPYFGRPFWGPRFGFGGWF